jgi:hypothetical protein
MFLNRCNENDSGGWLTVNHGSWSYISGCARTMCLWTSCFENNICYPNSGDLVSISDHLFCIMVCSHRIQTVRRLGWCVPVWRMHMRLRFVFRTDVLDSGGQVRTISFTSLLPSVSNQVTLTIRPNSAALSVSIFRIKHAIEIRDISAPLLPFMLWCLTACLIISILWMSVYQCIQVDFCLVLLQGSEITITGLPCVLPVPAPPASAGGACSAPLAAQVYCHANAS